VTTSHGTGTIVQIDGKTKAYQVRQVRAVILKYKMGEDV